MLQSLADSLTAAGFPMDTSGAAWVAAWALGVLGLSAAGIALRGRVNLKVWFGGLALVAPMVLVLAMGFQHDPRSIASPLVGKMAPDFELMPLDGTTPVRLSEQRGKVTVVNFWATWCIPCKAEHKTLVAVARRFAGKATFLGVVYQDEPETIRTWLGANGSAYPQLIDVGSKASIAFGVYGVPETFILDATGKITWKFTGPVEAGDLLERLAEAGAR